MERLVEGQESALNELMDRHGPKLFNYLVRLLQNESDAADVAQETFVRIYHNREKFKLDQKFSTWLYTIATNLVKDRFRYRTRHPEVSIHAESGESGLNLSDSLPANSPSPAEGLQMSERSDAVRHAVATLPEELRTPLVLAEYEELSHAEVAAILHCSPKAVETRIYRARQQLRLKLSGFFQAERNPG